MVRIISIILFFFCSLILFAQSIDELQSKLSNNKNLVNKLISKIDSLESSYPEYLIYGEIKDRAESYIYIWGSAIPKNNDFSSVGTVNEGNIIVINPSTKNILYNMYAEATHHFLYKGSGKNYFGSDVPVRFYGDIPATTLKEIEKLDSKLKIIEKENISLERKLADLLFEEKYREAKYLYENKKYIESIDILKKISDYDGNINDIDKLVLMNYMKVIENNIASGNFIDAIQYIEEGKELANKRRYYQNEFQDYYNTAYKNLAFQYYEEQNYLKAIQNFSKLNFDSFSEKNELKKMYAKSYYQIGNADLNQKQYEQAKIKYKSAISIDPTILSDVSKELNKYKRTPFLYGLYSLLPGLGQFAQGYNKEGYTQMGLFALALGSGLYYKIEADNIYSDYEIARSSSQAETLYEDANKKLNISYGLIGIASGLIIYSIIDAVSKANLYNEQFELNITTNGEQISSKAIINSINLSLKLYF